MFYPIKLVIVGLVALATATVEGAYTPAIGVKSVYYSAAAHCSEATLKGWDCGVPCDKVPSVVNVTPILNNAKGTYGFVGFNSHENQIVVSFRGSVNIENWITNIDFIKTNYKNIPGAQVHEGFYAAY